MASWTPSRNWISAPRGRCASQMCAMVENSYSLITTLLRPSPVSNRSAFAIGLMPADALVTIATSSGRALMKRAKAPRSAS
jgi:hypothetical protein